MAFESLKKRASSRSAKSNAHRPFTQPWTPPRREYDALTAEALPSLKYSRGETLPQEVLARSAATFERDLSTVRVHTDQRADRAAKQISARAFTAGTDVYFARGNYRPQTRDGLKLIGHELTHVVQQSNNLVHSGLANHPDPHEREAATVGRTFSEPTHDPTIGYTKVQPPSVTRKPALPHRGQSQPIQRESAGFGDTDGGTQLFAPWIEDSVGRGGVNNPGDIRTVTALLEEWAATGIDCKPDSSETDSEKRIGDAIAKFQKARKVGFDDGKIGNGRTSKTWLALTKPYRAPTHPPTARQNFKRTRNLMVTAANISHTAAGLIFVEDADKNDKDDAMAMRQKAAQTTDGIDDIRVTGINQLAATLEKYRDAKLSIDTMHLASHGSYSKSDKAFYLGNQKISKENVAELGLLRNYLTDSTKVIVTGCHIGGGKYADNGKKFTQAIADALGTVVYTNMSWSRSSEWLFYGDESYASYLDHTPDKFDIPEVDKETGEKTYDSKERPYVYKFMGQWLEATPGAKEPQIVNTPKYNESGGMEKLADERFPTWSFMDEFRYQAWLDENEGK